MTQCTLHMFINSFTGLENEMNVCNHRLKKLLHENRSDRNRLANIQTNLAYLSNSRKPPIKPEEDNMNLIEEYISNLTMKKRKFRSLGKNIESSMERMQRKIKDIKHKVLVRFLTKHALLLTSISFLTIVLVS